MNIITKEIICQGETLTLCNQRVVFWKAKEILILSDLHIGKTAHFRKNGIPISSQIMLDDLKRLKAVINFFKPKKLVIVGDLFHAEYNPDVAVFHSWIKEFQYIEWFLIKGNHDQRSFELFENTGIQLIDEYLTITPFTFQHHIKNKEEGRFYISGHTHPGVFITGKGRQRIKLPCFQQYKNQLVLPAFSLFTGLNTYNMTSKSVKYAFTDQTIIEVN